MLPLCVDTKLSSTVMVLLAGNSSKDAANPLRGEFHHTEVYDNVFEGNYRGFTCQTAILLIVFSAPIVRNQYRPSAFSVFLFVVKIFCM